MASATKRKLDDKRKRLERIESEAFRLRSEVDDLQEIVADPIKLLQADNEELQATVEQLQDQINDLQRRRPEREYVPVAYTIPLPHPCPVIPRRTVWPYERNLPWVRFDDRDSLRKRIVPMGISDHSGLRLLTAPK